MDKKNTPSWLQQFLRLARLFAHLEFRSFDRILGAILFSVVLSLMFYFASGDLESEVLVRIFGTQTVIVAFLSLQLLNLRILAPEEEDKAFIILRSMDLSESAWFWAKLLVMIASSLFVVIPSFCVSLFFYQRFAPSAPYQNLLLVAVLVVIGLSALGILLATLLQQADTKALVYPLLFFPLAVPVLLTALVVSEDILVRGKDLQSLAQSWLGLLLVFDMIYLALGQLLFGEIVKLVTTQQNSHESFKSE